MTYTQMGATGVQKDMDGNGLLLQREGDGFQNDRVSVDNCIDDSDRHTQTHAHGL
jgi:hypothetical protein